MSDQIRNAIAALAGGASVLGANINRRKDQREAARLRKEEADEDQKRALALIAARSSASGERDGNPVTVWAGDNLLQYDPTTRSWAPAMMPGAPPVAPVGHGNDADEHGAPSDVAMGALTGANVPLPRVPVTKPATVKPTPADPLARRSPIKVLVDGKLTQATIDGRGNYYDALARPIAGKIEAYQEPDRLPLVTGVGPDGKPVRVVDKPGVVMPSEATTDKPATDAQNLAAGFADRMVEADQTLSQLENDPKTRRMLVGTIGAPSGSGDVPLIGNWTLSKEGQLYKNAQSNWVRANLRKESGAAIGNDEMASEIKTYFPQPGDSDELITQKAKLRKIAEANMRRNAGRAATRYSPDNPFAKPPV